MGGNVRGVKAGGVGSLIGPYLPEDAKVGKDGEVDSASVLDGKG